jgi:hypothetical protein
MKIDEAEESLEQSAAQARLAPAEKSRIQLRLRERLAGGLHGRKLTEDLVRPRQLDDNLYRTGHGRKYDLAVQR